MRVHDVPAAEASQVFGWIFIVFGPMGPLLIAYLAKKLTDRGYQDANMTAGMIGGILTIPTVLLIQAAPTATWAFILYAPALLAVNSPFGIAAGVRCP